MSLQAPDVRRLEEARAQLAAGLIEALPQPERTLIVQLLAGSFVDTYAAALAERRPEALVEWTQRMWSAHADSPAVAALFRSAPEVLEESLRCAGFSEAYRAPLRSLRAPVRAVAARPRRHLTPVSERFDEVDAAINEAILRLSHADPLTAEHSRAVSAWCSRLARRLTLSEREATFVARCGLIHDIGKVSTPSTVLNAPRALDEAEWKIMREHTTAGERIVRDDVRLAQFAVAVRSHHERLDGRGYPDRLEADGIGAVVRIVTVADCFNAMIGRRPYRPAMSPARALEQLEAGAGAQFDGEIVAAMRDLVAHD
jgi:putative nucleotidyltransferase with HDIG domain